MDQLIPILNKLQDVTAHLNLPIELPQIVVVGSQSSGKSSVLESIVGRDFLPRGSGIVTRRPLVLQLHKLVDRREEWGEFKHLPDVTFTDFHDILVEIESATNDIQGDKSISDAPIYLKIFSPRVLDLTLVDLPGITKVPVGAQPRNIEDMIRNMILTYIENPNSIILAISAANSDLANSDSLKLAKEVDPDGLRTLGVLTKIDLMDKGTDALDILNNQVYPLRLGYVGIVCRSQDDINKKVQISTHLQSETAFFKSHPIYSAIANRLGSKYLSKRLNELLLGHLKEHLPVLKKKMTELMMAKEEEMRSYGVPLSGSQDAQGALLLSLLQSFQKRYGDMIEGRMCKISSNELEGGARVNNIFNNEYKKELQEMNPFDQLQDLDIRTTLLNSTGIRQALFIPESAFEILAKKLVVRLLDPSLRCAERVLQELQEMVQHRMDFPELDRFSVLKETIMDVVNDLLKKCQKPTVKMIGNLIEVEKAYINIQHPDFIGGSAALSAVNQEMQQRASEEAKSEQPPPVRQEPPVAQNKSYFLGLIPRANWGARQAEDPPVPQVPNHSPSMRVNPQPSNREMMETEVVKKMLDSYFSLVRKNVSDLVPKTIACKLVYRSVETMQHELVSKLYRKELYDQLLAESSDIAIRRLKCQEELSHLQQAHEVLAEVRDCTG